MAQYVQTMLSTHGNYKTAQVIIRTAEPLEDKGIMTLHELPQCEVMDLETGKILSGLDVERMEYVEIYDELSGEARKSILSNIEEYHRQEIADAKEFFKASKLF